MIHSDKVAKVKPDFVGKHAQLPIKLKSFDWRRYVPKHWKKDIRRIIFVALYYIVGCLVYRKLEGWDVIKSCYFVTISCLSVGFGDIYPSSNSSRAFTMAMSVFGMACIFTMISGMAARLYFSLEHRTVKAFVKTPRPISRIYRPIRQAFILILVVSLGSIYLSITEKWSYLDGIYFSVVVGTTVGYGDLSPSHDSTKLYVIFYGYICVTLMMLLIGSIATVKHEIALEKKKELILSRTVDLELITEYDRDGSGIDKAEFVFGILDQLEFLSFEEDCKKWMDRFDALDVDNNKCLDAEDIKRYPGGLSENFDPETFAGQVKNTASLIFHSLHRQMSDIDPRAAMRRLSSFNASSNSLAQPVHMLKSTDHNKTSNDRHATFAPSCNSPVAKRLEAIHEERASTVVKHNTAESIIDAIFNSPSSRGAQTARSARSSRSSKATSRSGRSARVTARSTRDDGISDVALRHQRQDMVGFHGVSDLISNVPIHELIQKYSVNKNAPKAGDSESLWEHYRRTQVITDEDIELWIRNATLLAIVVGFYAIGVVFYHNVEGWNILDCLYFVSVTLSTAGFGDFAPKTSSGRLFTIFYIAFAIIVVFTSLINVVTDAMAGIERRTRLFFGIRGTFGDDKTNHRLRWLLSLTSLFGCIVIGTIVYKNIEYNVNEARCGKPGWPDCGSQWGWFQSFYFCVISTLSVGFGDFTVSNKSGKVFCMIYVLTSVLLVTSAINNMISIRTEELLESEIQRKLNVELSADMLFAMDSDDNNSVDKYEFVSGILDQLGIINKVQDCDPWARRFDELDVDGSGRLDKKDIMSMGDGLAKITTKGLLSMKESETSAKSSILNKPMSIISTSSKVVVPSNDGETSTTSHRQRRTIETGALLSSSPGSKPRSSPPKSSISND